MARPSKWNGEIFTGTRTETRPNGVKYIYDQQYRYDPVSKKTKVVGSHLKGKIMPGSDKIVRTRPKKESTKNNAEEKTKAKRVHVGSCDILDWAGKESGIGDDVKKSLPEEEALRALSLANYLCATESTLPGFESWQLTHPMPYPGSISEATYGRLFADIGNNESWVQSYFEKRAARLSPSPALTLDSTLVSTYSEEPNSAGYGYSRDLPVIKYCTLYSVKDAQPIAYANKSGNIPDAITIESSLKQLESLGVDMGTVVTDCGYVSVSNIDEFFRMHRKFLSPVKRTLKWVKPVVEELLPKLGGFSTIYPLDPTVYGAVVEREIEFDIARKRSRGDKKAGESEAVKRRLYIGVYRNTQVQKDETNKLYEDILMTKELWESGKKDFEDIRKNFFERYFTVSTLGRDGKEKLSVNEEAFEEAIKFMGVFVLVTNKKMDAFEMLATYRLRKEYEESFSIPEGHLDEEKSRVQNEDGLRGRQFVQFIALGLRSFLHKRLKELKESLMKNNGRYTREELSLRRKLLTWLENKSVLQILQWFDCTEETTIKNERGQYRWCSEIVQRDALFLELLGMEI